MDRNRNDSSRLGDQQAEGNLGNERNRNSPDSSRSERGRSSERVINRSSESESDSDSDSSEAWSPDSETSDSSRSDR
jgi:hypothetical protein